MNGFGGRLAAGRTADHHEGYRPSRVFVTEEPQPDDGPGSFRVRMRMARDGGDPRLLGWVARMEVHSVMSGRNKALHLAGRARERTLIWQAKGGILYVEQRSGDRQRHSPNWDLHGQCHPVPRTIDGIYSEEKSFFWELGPDHSELRKPHLSATGRGSKQASACIYGRTNKVGGRAVTQQGGLSVRSRRRSQILHDLRMQLLAGQLAPVAICSAGSQRKAPMSLPPLRPLLIDAPPDSACTLPALAQINDMTQFAASALAGCLSCYAFRKTFSGVRTCPGPRASPCSSVLYCGDRGQEDMAHSNCECIVPAV
jgi:hypothetical protein